MNEIKISEKGVNKLLSNINPNKATGPDELCGKVFKEMNDHLVLSSHESSKSQLTRIQYLQTQTRTMQMSVLH